MNKYCFELYEYGDRGQLFLGHKQVRALTAEDALLAVKEGLNDNVHVFQIYINQDK